MRGHVLNTDFDWYQSLRAQSDLDEVNFWRPGKQGVRAERGTPMIFKLKSPQNAICGFGFFSRYQRVPLWQAWEIFETANGVASQAELLTRLSRIASRNAIEFAADPQIGCVVVVQPVFFEPDEWVELPADWSPNIVTGKTYDLATGEGKRIWTTCLARYEQQRSHEPWVADELERAKAGKPRLVTPRLGQASFRLDVQSAYSGKCAVTQEHSLPVLEAAHIVPWGAGGPNEVSNGIFLRSDLHRLFDRGYVTFDEDARFVVSHLLKDEWQNGKTYYALHGAEAAIPADDQFAPDQSRLAWHRDNVFRE